MNLTQTQICKKLHLCQNTYSLIESGKSIIDNDRLIKLAEILKVKPQDLLSEEELFQLRSICGIEYNIIEQKEVLNYKALLTHYHELLELKEKQIQDQLNKLDNLLKQFEEYKLQVTNLDIITFNY